MPSYRYFYNKFYYEYFYGKGGYTGFFEAHFLHHGKYRSANVIKPRNECPQNKKRKIDRIYEHTESIKIKKNLQ